MESMAVQFYMPAGTVVPVVTRPTVTQLLPVDITCSELHPDRNNWEKLNKV